MGESTLIGDPRSFGKPTIPGREIGPGSGRTVSLSTAATEVTIGSGKYHIDLHYATSSVRAGNTATHLLLGGSDVASGGAIVMYPGQTFQYRNVTSDFSIYVAAASGTPTLDIVEYETTPETVEEPA